METMTIKKITVTTQTQLKIEAMRDTDKVYQVVDPEGNVLKMCDRRPQADMTVEVLNKASGAAGFRVRIITAKMLRDDPEKWS
jgi:hypothetical protein